jgi:hypothetical protein
MAAAMAAVIDAWVSEVRSIDEQRAVRKREEDVAMEKQGVQQLLVYMAGSAKGAQQSRGAAAGVQDRGIKRQRVAE